MKIPKYRLHKSSGQAVVEHRGKRTYLGIHGSKESREAYARFLHSINADPAAGNGNGASSHVATTAAGSGSLTILGLCAKFATHARKEYADPSTGQPSKEYKHLSKATLPLRELYGDLEVSQFGPRCLKTVRQAFVAAGHTRTHVNAQTQRIRRVFRWGVGEELVPSAVLLGLEAVKGLKKGKSEAREGTKVKPVADSEINKIIPFVLPEVAKMMQLQRASGMRSTEVCLMRPCDIDRSGATWIYRPMRHKTIDQDKERPVALGVKAQAILRPLLANLPPDSTQFIFSPATAVEAHRRRRNAARKTRVQPSQVARRAHRKRKPKRTAGEHYTADSYRKAILRGIDGWAAANGITEDDEIAQHHWTPHRIRHARATEVRRSYGLEGAQVVMGHANAKVTEIYAERDLALALKIAAESG